jgi:galactokinase
MSAATDASRTAPSEAAFEQVIALFQRTYGIAPAVVASAPGRVNLIGEHLDYNGGPVLPFAIDRRTWVAAALAPTFELVTAESGLPAVRRELGPPQGDWGDYVVGVAGALGAIPGARMAVTSELTPGAGLSSSAALAVASAAALVHLAGLDRDADALADLAFRAEHDYVGVRCGRMDQTVVAHAVAGQALLLDTATGARVACPFPHSVWIVPTGVEHRLTAGGYNERRAECTRALELLQARWPALGALAALDPSSLAEALTVLPPPLHRRVRHVVTETARTREAGSALAEGAMGQLGRLLSRGHTSLKDDYESSVREADYLVSAAVGHGALGARLTGAGWGGSVVVLVPEAEAADVVGRTATDFGRRFGRVPAAWRATAAGGVRIDLAG